MPEEKEKIEDKVNEILENKNAQTLIKLGFRIDSNFEALSQIAGIKSAGTPLVLMDKEMVMLYTKIKIDKDKVIAKFPLKQFKIALKLDLDTVNVTAKDYPCIISSEVEDANGYVEAVLIAPRVD